MNGWIIAAVAALVAVPFVWLGLRKRAFTSDLDPVSAQWLAEQKRATDDAAM